MGRVSGEVMREANMLARSYRDPIKKHEPKLANRYSIDFGDTTGKFLSRVGGMSFAKRKSEYDDLQARNKQDNENYEKNKRFILKHNYCKTKRWNQNVKTHDNLIGTFKLDKKVLYSPAQSLKTLKHAVTEKQLHRNDKF